MQIRRSIRRPEVLSKTGLSATTIYNMEKRGEFPLHFMLTPRCAAWDEEEVDAWLAARKTAATTTALSPDVTRRKTNPVRQGGRAAA